MHLIHNARRIAVTAMTIMMTMTVVLSLHSRTLPSEASVLMRNKVASEYKPWIGLSIPELTDVGRKALCDTDSFPTAIKAFTTILGRYDGGAYGKDDIRDIVSAMNNLGYIYTFHYLDYQKGIRHLNQALDLAESNGIKSLIPVICLNLGAIYSLNQTQFAGLSFPEKTMTLYSKGLDTALEIKDWKNYLRLLNNMLDMSVSISHRTLPETILSDFRASSAEVRDNPMFLFTEAHADAYEAFVNKNYGKALSIYSDMETKTSGFQDEVRYQLMALSERAEIFKHIKDYRSAADEIKRGLRIARTHRYDDITLTFYDEARKLYSSLGENEKAEQYYVSYLKQRDSILNACSMKAVSEFEFHNEMDRMENTVRDLSYHKKIQNLWLWIMGGLTFLAILFVIYYIYTNRRLRQSNRSLYRKTLNAIRTEDSNFVLRKENEELRARISALSRQDDESDTPDKKNKYSYSQLDDGRKEAIRQKIETIIETDRDVFSQDFSLGMLADKVGCPQTYLSQVFGEKIGKNFYTILSERRIKEACRMMADPSNSNLSIEGIATKVGIRSRSNFTTLFKKFTGLTPAQFARQTREN